ncbi:glycoside hydrolase family 88 protein [Aquiflexum sp. LQ15W]|uniref:glycoside hydrolase family 88/105 protein n=1 Tax=Cognataquiflexum nitidum TaxID=2922272 RepID=UPI001F138A88|nr:glycoside hydrolase family 88 protein [Cognataquiflexum nitidum]MCH6198923.1 glycoside hydrolase family 88 protein [Cognataquiflexum nitidum]
MLTINRYKKLKAILLFFCISIFGNSINAQQGINDSNTPLHLLQPNYPLPYGKSNTEEIKKVLDRVFYFLEKSTPARLKDKQSGLQLNKYSGSMENAEFEKSLFRLTSYEWGVTYAGMLRVAEVTKDKQYQDYVFSRLGFLADLYPVFQTVSLERLNDSPMRSVVTPHALDDAGAIGVSMIKAKYANFDKNLDPMIENFIDFISNKEFRLNDGTFARNRPIKNTLWLDDLFMSVPALAWYSLYKDSPAHLDDAIKQVLQFSEKMFDDKKGIYRHGLVEGQVNSPSFHWARANGWAFMAIVELLSVMENSHPLREKVLYYYKAHAVGLSNYQSSTGFWHQLLDRNDSYLETSATAIFTYGFAKGINEGWIDYRVFGPSTLLAWEAVASKVNEIGQVEGTCVGTGMGFDPAFYYYRPVNVFAAHGYGPVLLAGAEISALLINFNFELNEKAVQFLEK